MTTADKIAIREEKIKKCRAVILAEQAKLNKYQEEIEELEGSELKSLIKQSNIPIAELKELIKNNRK